MSELPPPAKIKRVPRAPQTQDLPPAPPNVFQTISTQLAQTNLVLELILEQMQIANNRHP